MSSNKSYSNLSLTVEQRLNSVPINGLEATVLMAGVIAMLKFSFILHGLFSWQYGSMAVWVYNES